jgi:hypothetical protein
MKERIVASPRRRLVIELAAEAVILALHHKVVIDVFAGAFERRV